jgi:hypothetical protein
VATNNEKKPKAALTLRPLGFEEAVTGLLQVKPQPKGHSKPKAKKAAKRSK